MTMGRSTVRLPVGAFVISPRLPGLPPAPITGTGQRGRRRGPRMKSTIKLSTAEAIVIEPGQGGGVKFSATVGGLAILARNLTADQAGAAIFALEQAIEAAQIATQRQGAQA